MLFQCITFDDDGSQGFEMYDHETDITKVVTVGGDDAQGRTYKSLGFMLDAPLPEVTFNA